MGVQMVPHCPARTTDFPQGWAMTVPCQMLTGHDGPHRYSLEWVHRVPPPAEHRP